ncbi:hypothetical protein NQ317_009585 [Molorchus minor]|uniref:Uncharacterized protein n=1 Tax=Molorchus minor TaxID=1323400 RepID=A0ABQ9J603_9CUCU|nr:hypothetical protein NQ317_009585 [Molorchus minor]
MACAPPAISKTNRKIFVYTQGVVGEYLNLAPRMRSNSLPAIKNKPSSTLTTGNVGVNIVKVIQ